MATYESAEGRDVGEDKNMEIQARVMDQAQGARPCKIPGTDLQEGTC